MTIDVATLAEPRFRKVVLERCGDVVRELYPLRAPEATPLPFVTYQRISGSDLQSHGGNDGATRVRIQLSTFAEGYRETLTISETIRRRVEGYRGNGIQAVISGDGRDLIDPDTGVPYRVQDYLVWALTGQEA